MRLAAAVDPTISNRSVLLLGLATVLAISVARPDDIMAYPVDWLVRLALIGTVFAALGYKVARSFFVFDKALIKTLPTMLAVGLVIVAFAEVNAFLSDKFVPNPAWSTKGWPPYGEAWGVRLVDLSLGLLLVSISEELLFRAVLVTYLEERGVTAQSIYCIGIVLFAAVHIQGGLEALIVAAGGGSALIWLYRQTRSVWPSVGAHTVWNFWAFW